MNQITIQPRLGMSAPAPPCRTSRRPAMAMLGSALAHLSADAPGRQMAEGLNRVRICSGRLGGRQAAGNTCEDGGRAGRVARAGVPPGGWSQVAA